MGFGALKGVRGRIRGGRGMKPGGPMRLIATVGAVFGGGILRLSMVSSIAVREVQMALEAKRKKTAPTCDFCRGRRFIECRLCKGNSIIYWSPLLDQMVPRPCLCPTCDGNRVQRCLNCLGKGYV